MAKKKKKTLIVKCPHCNQLVEPVAIYQVKRKKNIIPSYVG